MIYNGIKYIGVFQCGARDFSRSHPRARLSQAGGSSKVRGRREGTLVCESRDLLRYYRVLLHAGAWPAHAFQRRLGDHLMERQVKRMRELTRHSIFVN